MARKDTDREFARNIREALLRDPQLVQLLGGRHVYEDASSSTPDAHISIAQSRVLDSCFGWDLKGERTITLQVWPKTSEKGRAQEIIETAHLALEGAGLIDGNAPIQLKPEYSGSRRLPQDREYHGILRYHAVRQNEAA